MVNPILRMLSPLGAKVNKSLVLIILSYCKFVYRLSRKNGMRFVVIYLKACSTVLQQSCGGQVLQDMSPLGLRFKRTKSGLPELIPPIHRKRIRNNEVFVIRFWFSLFSIYRVLEIPGKLKVSTITKPGTMPGYMVSQFSSFVFGHFLKAVRFNFGSAARAVFPTQPIGKGSKSLKATPFIIRKSSPSVEKVDPFEKIEISPVSTSPMSIIYAACLWKESDLYPQLQAWCRLTNSIWVLNAIDRWSKIPRFGSGWVPVDKGGNFQPGSLGKLGLKLEPAGKIRVFAMVDPFTQWLMKPLHELLFKLLRCIPQDGTFNQVAPLKALLSKSPARVYSYDLSAATDRLPIALQKVLLSRLLTGWGSELWGSLLVGRPYWLVHSDLNKSPTRTVSYAVGQPMGALSSWAMLALTHHAIVQWAAASCGAISFDGKSWFTDYALLGDDICIGNAKVAKAYKSLMTTLGVEIGDHKSLVSLSGRSVEFAKKFFVKGTDGKFHDCSAISFAEMTVATASLDAGLELVSKERMTLTQYLSMLGYGYKAKGRASARLLSLPRRMRHYILAFLYRNVNSPDTFVDWLATRSLTTSYKLTDSRYSNFFLEFFSTERESLMKMLEKFPRQELFNHIVRAKRDREYYGTAVQARSENEPTFGVDPTSWPTLRPMIDEIVELVYRETYLDAVIDVRDAYNRIEEMGGDVTSFPDLWHEAQSLTETLAGLPLPSGLDVRAQKRFVSSNKKLFDKWYLYSQLFRSKGGLRISPSSARADGD